LNSFIHQNHILPPEQFGFHKQHSTLSLNLPESPTSSPMALTLQRGGFKHPVHTVVWEGFSSGHLNFELNCAGVYSK
jgi:hypothetical protein